MALTTNRTLSDLERENPVSQHHVTSTPSGGEMRQPTPFPSLAVTPMIWRQSPYIGVSKFFFFYKKINAINK